jgi:hypothetical protein
MAVVVMEAQVVVEATTEKIHLDHQVTKFSIQPEVTLEAVEAVEAPIQVLLLDLVVLVQ